MNKIFQLSAIALAFTISLAGCSNSSSVAQKKETLIIGTEASYAPFEYLDKDKKIVGFDISLISEVCKMMQRQCKVVNGNWDDLLPDLEKGKYDAVISAMTITPERQQKVDFTNSYFTNTLAFVSKVNTNLDLNNMTDVNVGVLKGASSTKLLQSKYAGAKISVFESQSDALKALLVDKVDSVIADKAALFDWLNGQDRAAYSLQSIKDADAEQFGIAVKKGNELRNDLNLALEAYQSLPAYKKLYNKYFVDFQWEESIPDVMPDLDELDNVE